MILAFPGCRRTSGAPSSEESLKKENDLTHAAQEKADSLLSSLTLEQQVGLTLMPALYARNDDATLILAKKYASDYHAGGFLLLKGTAKDAAALLDTLQKGCPVPITGAVDAEWGLGMRFSDAPSFPANGMISPSADEDLMYAYGNEVARECRMAGIDMVMGPVADVVPRFEGNPIGTRSFGGDARKVATLAAAYLRGLEDGGVMAVAKHFPGHGSADTDSHQALPEIKKSLTALEKEDLYPFKVLIDNGLSAIMVGHIHAMALDSVARPADMSECVVREWLRGKLNFKGLVITDAVNMGGASGYSPLDALKAGADIVVAPADISAAFRQILDATTDGTLPYEMLREKCRRILFYKFLQELKAPRECPGSTLFTPEAESLRRNLLGEN